MSLRMVDRSEIAADTAKLGQELMAEDNLYRQLGDKLASLVKDEDFVWMYSPLGGPGLSPVILALVTVLQMLEKLPDRLAAEMVRVRIDWK